MVTNDISKCSGCGMCAAICPKKTLEIKLNSDGFYVPYVVNDDCINCSLCDRVCPQNAKRESVEPVDVYSVFSCDESTLGTTSSGGICYELAKSAIEEGKKVCGVIYDYDDDIAKHVMINNLSELEHTKGSKYFQSFTPDAFCEVIEDKCAVVFGTPCQIYAISQAAKMKGIRDNLLLVDFFCHGTPSMHVWKKYINSKKDKKIQKITFRSKEAGWHKFAFGFKYDDGSQNVDYDRNSFYRVFFSNTCLNNSCYDCNFKALNSAADIRVGDFWGKKYSENTAGVSSCLVFTQKGKDYIDKISDKCNITPEMLDDALEGQMFKSPIRPSCNKRVIKALKTNKTLDYICEKTMFAYRVKCKIKSVVRSVKK